MEPKFYWIRILPVNFKSHKEAISFYVVMTQTQSIELEKDIKNRFPNHLVCCSFIDPDKANPDLVHKLRVAYLYGT